jgi:hypothetical protein
MNFSTPAKSIYAVQAMAFLSQFFVIPNFAPFK